MNTDSSNNTSGDEGFIVFDELCLLTKNKAINDGRISTESISNHKNDLQLLKNAIEEYYASCIAAIEEKIEGIIRANSLSDGTGKIGIANADENEVYVNLRKRLDEYNRELERYHGSYLYNLPIGSLGIEKAQLDIALNPILERYNNTINKYLDVLLDLFEKFCSEVTDKSLKMTRFISYLTIEEFRVMADNYE